MFLKVPSSFFFFDNPLRKCQKHILDLIPLGLSLEGPAQRYRCGVLEGLYKVDSAPLLPIILGLTALLSLWCSRIMSVTFMKGSFNKYPYKTHYLMCSLYHLYHCCWHCSVSFPAALLHIYAEEIAGLCEEE